MCVYNVFLIFLLTMPLQTLNCGWGVKCTQALRVGDLVIEYCGEVIDEDESNRRLAVMKSIGEQNFYLFAVSHDYVRFLEHVACF